METAFIREINRKDSAEVARLIRLVLEDLGVSKMGTAFADKALDHMYENYDVPRATYFVLEERGRIIGCAGIAQLDSFVGNICELQKMYLIKEARGRGLGAKMITICLERAKIYGFEKCYLETMPYMKAAQKLYLKNGFEYIDDPMGDTGHYSCQVWMLKEL
ncbi:MAG: GNAT family N-acetyltransferase [Flavobacteriaceae bacterium]